MIEADSPTMTVDLQTLIAYGKKLEQNEKTLADYEIKDGNFMIVMVAKVSKTCSSHTFVAETSRQIRRQ